jgi:hypothetical protein
MAAVKYNQLIRSAPAKGYNPITKCSIWNNNKVINTAGVLRSLRKMAKRSDDKPWTIY